MAQYKDMPILMARPLTQADVDANGGVIGQSFAVSDYLTREAMRHPQGCCIVGNKKRLS